MSTRGEATPAQLAMMLGFGLLAQAGASGRFAFAAAAWLSLLPLAVFVRATRLPVAAAATFAVVLAGRAAGLVGVVDDGLGAAATAATLTTAALLVYRHVMRELPLWGSFSLPAAVVVAEAIAAAGSSSSSAPAWALWTTQVADTPLWRFVDVVTPAGVTFAVAWAQAVMAGFGESWIVEDPHDQATRERGLRLGANLCFAVVVVVVHGGGFFRADVLAPDLSAAATRPAVGACAAVVVVLLLAATAARARRGGAPLKAPSPA